MRVLITLAAILACVITPDLLARQIQPSGFHITIIDGEGALNNVKGRLAREPIVQVEDRNHKPVVGAYVEFGGPSSGPGGVFADGSTHFVTTTDSYGRAVAHGFRPNNVAGKFELHVHVTYQGQPIGDVTIHETNVSPQIAHLSKNVENTAVGVAVAAAAAGVLGIATGSEFLLDGKQVAGNANLMNGARIQTLTKTVRLDLPGQSEFLIAPHSTATVGPSQLMLQNGTVRALHFANYHVRYNQMEVAGLDNTSDAVMQTTTGGTLQVASVSGEVQVLGANGVVAGTVAPGTLTAYGQVPIGGSGATAAGVGMTTTKALAIYGTTLGATLGSLGLAVDAILQGGPAPQSP